MAAYLPQARLDLQHRRGHPPMLLLRVPPAVNLVGPPTDQGIEVLDAVGGLERRPQLLEDAQAVQRPFGLPS